ncbi:MAG TPA: hypothetical protein VK517_00530, partial [Cyclobacteriaceae bacterium]|nr:hypothetical protein [Cyclobacteriaceae bacterium]
LGVSLLQREFPDVREVSMEVLKVFYDLLINLSIRELRQFIRDFVDIRSGEVRWSNVPQNWYQRLGIRVPDTLAEEPMIEVRGEAASPAIYARYKPESIGKGAKVAA